MFVLAEPASLYDGRQCRGCLVLIKAVLVTLLAEVCEDAALAGITVGNPWARIPKTLDDALHGALGGAGKTSGKVLQGLASLAQCVTNSGELPVPLH